MVSWPSDGEAVLVAARRGRRATRPARTLSADELPQPLPPLVAVVGDEELLVTRAIAAVSAAARRDDPEVTETERLGADIEGPELHELLGPSLFGDSRLVVHPQRPGPAGRPRSAC